LLVGYPSLERLEGRSHLQMGCACARACGND
jgi:hypothetical protein